MQSTRELARTPPPSAGRARRFHAAVWRWHFYAGVGVLPFIVLLAASGLAMLASEPLDRYLAADLLTVQPQGSQLTPSEQAAAAAAAFPGAELVTFRATASPTESTRIEIAAGSHHAATAGHEAAATTTVYVDPYTGLVLGQSTSDDTLYAWAKALHGTLLLGAFGDYVIEIAAGFGVLMIATGLYLWWPREGRSLRAALKPPREGTSRRRWRDLHAVTAAWATPLLLFFLISGLAWTPFWGGRFVQTWSSLPGEQFTAPLATATHESLDHGAHRTVPWAIARTPLPAAGSQRGAPGIAVVGRPIGIDDVIAYARGAGLETFRVHWPRGEHGVWTIASTTIGGDTRAIDGDRIVHLDPGTGNVLGDVGFADYSPMAKFMAAGIPLHQADTGGVNLALNALFCLVVLGMSGAAVGAWWARRPVGAKRLAPPPLPRDLHTWRGAIALMFAASLAFPLAAATIAFVLAIDLLLLSRVGAFRTRLQ